MHKILLKEKDRKKELFLPLFLSFSFKRILCIYIFAYAGESIHLYTVWYHVSSSKYKSFMGLLTLNEVNFHSKVFKVYSLFWRCSLKTMHKTEK